MSTAKSLAHTGLSRIDTHSIYIVLSLRDIDILTSLNALVNTRGIWIVLSLRDIDNVTLTVDIPELRNEHSWYLHRVHVLGHLHPWTYPTEHFCFRHCDTVMKHSHQILMRRRPCRIGKKEHKQITWVLVSDSASFLAEISVSSPRKIIIFII